MSYVQRLTFAFAFTLALPAAVLAAAGDSTFDVYRDGTFVSSVSSLSAAVSAVSSGAAGAWTIRANKDYTCTEYCITVSVGASKPVTIDTNGKTITGKANQRMFVIKNKSKVTLAGSGMFVGNGTVTDTSAYCWAAGGFAVVGNEASPADRLVLDGPTLKNFRAKNHGGAICLTQGSAFEMKSGMITGCVSGGMGGGAIGIEGQAGNVFIMSGGTICGNTANDAGDFGGGGVCCHSSVCKMILTGGVISNNVSSTTGAGINGNATIAVGGDIRILDNVDAATKGDLYLPNGITVAVTNAPALAAGAKIGVTTQTAPAAGGSVAVTDATGASQAKYFTSDNPAYTVMNAGNPVVLANLNKFYVSSSGNDSNAGTVAAPLKTLAAAYNKITSVGTIALLSDIDAPSGSTPALLVSSGKTITITSAKANGDLLDNAEGDYTGVYTIHRASNTATLMHLSNGSLALRQVVVSGDAKSFTYAGSYGPGYLIFAPGNVADDTLSLGVNCILRDNIDVGNNGGACGSGVCFGTENNAHNPKMYMSANAAILGCIAPRHGGAITMYDGDLYMSDNATMMYNGVEYKPAYSAYYGGGAILAYRGNVHMSGNATVTKNYVQLNGGSDSGRMHNSVQIDPSTASIGYVSGNARIFDNYDDGHLTRNADGSYVIIGTKQANAYADVGKFYVDGALGANAKIGVTVKNAGVNSVVANGSASYTVTPADADKFFDDTQTYYVSKHASNNQLVFGGNVVAATLTLGTLSTTSLSGTFSAAIGATANDFTIFKDGVKMEGGYTVTVSGTTLSIAFDPALSEKVTIGVGVSKNGYKVNNGQVTYVGRHKHCLCGASGSAAHCAAAHDDTQLDWQPWTSTITLPTSAGNWYLMSDVTLTAAYTPVDGVKLCLNGKVVKQTAAVSVVTVSSGTFTFTDCDAQGRGAFTGGKGANGAGGQGGFLFLTGGTVNQYGGVLRGNSAGNAGGAVKMSGGTYNFYNGLMTDNVSGNNGNAVQLDGSGVFNMYGGAIAGNHSDSTAGAGYPAGAIHIWNGQCNLFGGAITNNWSTQSAGGVSLGNNGKLTIGGTIRIADNTGAGTPNNVYLYSGKTITLSTAAPLAADVKIGVTTAVTPTAAQAGWVPVTGANTANYAGNFRADAGYAVINDANVVKLAAFAAKLTPYDGTARPVTGESYTYRPGGTGSATTVPYDGMLVVESGVSNYYYATVEMAIEAAKAGAVNTGYCSAANPNGCFQEGTPYDYANNDSLNPNLGKYTDTVTLCKNAGRLYNMGNSYSATAPYGIRKGIVIDLNGYGITAIAAGRIPDGQVLVFRNGTISSGAMATDVLDDEPGTGYLPGAIAFADVNMTGTIWASTHAFFLLNGQYDIRLGNPANPSEDPSLLQLRGGSYKNDPRGYNIDYTDCHIELASKHPEIEPYFCRVVKGGSRYTVTFLNKASSSDETLGGQPFYNTPTNVVYVYGGSVAQTPAVTKPGAKLLGWTTSATGTVPEYTNDQLSMITSENEANVILYSVYGVEVGVPVFVALDACSTLPTDGREYTFVITNLDSFTKMPANRFATIPVPPGRGEANCIGYGPDDLDNPWRMTYPAGDYYYHVSQVTNGIHAGETLDEGRWEIQLEVDPDATPRYKISSAIYYGKVADIDENSFHIVKANNNVAAKVTVEGSKTKVALGGNQVVNGDAFNTAVMKGKFAIDFTRNFRVVGSFTPPKASTPDGTCVGFMPNTQTLYQSDLIGGGNLGYIGNTKFAKSLVLDFDPYNNGSSYGDPGYNHFTLTETMDNGYPNYSTAQHKNVSSCWPTSASQYSIVNDTTENKLYFKVTLPNGTILDYAYANPTNLFKSKTAYFFMSGVVRYGSAGSWGLGSAGSTAPSLTMYFDSFNYLGQREGYGSVTNIFVNRQEAKVTYNAWSGAFADGEETRDVYAIDATAWFPPVPTRAGGYNFEGWYTSWTNGAVTVADGAVLDPIADCTRYAKWTSPSVPREEGEKTLDHETTPDGKGASLKGATNVLETTDLAVPELTSNGTDGLPYKVIKTRSFAYGNYDAKREDEGQSGKRITSVTVSTYITNIQSYAFQDCKALTNVTFSKTRDYQSGGKSKLVIDDWAFKGTSVQTITFPADSCVELDYGAFADAKQLRDIYILGDVSVKSRYPFLGAGKAYVKATGEPVKVHLSAKLASDPDYVAALTNGMSAARVVLSQEIQGTVTVGTGPTISGDTVSFTFTVESDSPWLTVNTDTIYLFWSTTLSSDIFIGNAPKHPTSLVKNADGSWTATFEKPAAAGASATFFQLRIGD